MALIQLNLSDKIKSQFTDLYNKMDKNSEFEFIFFSRSNEYYLNVLKYLEHLNSSSKKIQSMNIESNLDINFTPSKTTTYRIAIPKENITKIIKKAIALNDKNWKIYQQILNDNKTTTNLEVIQKTKLPENTIDMTDFDIRVRLSDEITIDPMNYDAIINILNDDANIIYRYKERISFYLDNIDKNNYTKIDITMVRTTKNINKINEQNMEYELEIESKQSNTKINRLQLMYEFTESLLKIQQQSNFIISNTTKTKILKQYETMLSVPKDIHQLYGRQAISLEIHHTIELLPNKYAVSDKVDGERCFCIIIDENVYLINTNLNMKDTGIVLKTNKYNNTIFDGEYVYISKYNRYAYLIFDCLFANNKDMRTISTYMTRYNMAQDIINNIFKTNYKRKTYDGKMILNNILEFHTKEITSYMNNLDKELEKKSNFPVIQCKYFIPVHGIVPWEIFSYSTLIWTLLTENSNVKCPYLLDGLVYHPLEQEYVVNIKESKMMDYKWKPPNKNSIDFYIIFKKDPISGKELPVYDNTSDKYVKNKTYKICNLYVGKNIKGKEQPFLFKEENGLHEAYILLEDGEVRDQDGNIILTETVVEFYYNDDANVPFKFRWVPIRTRYDKTESVKKHNKRYGNYFNKADLIWQSIINPVVMEDFISFAKGNDAYNTKLNEMKNKINNKTIIASNKEDRYYQQQNILTKPMRNFHNFIKSNMIYTYFNSDYNGEQLSVLDIGGGQGGDILKLYHANVKYAVIIDIDKETLFSSRNGALNRYNTLKKNYPGFPKMYFIHADGGVQLDYDKQNIALGGMIESNMININKFFGKEHQFDRGMCQFAIHYFLKNQTTWNNFKENINKNIKSGGYFLVTTFDANEVIKLLKNKDSHKEYYTTNNGVQKILFEIINKYKIIDSKIIGIGNPIDLYASWMFNEGKYHTEYLVDPIFLEQELDQFKLIESDLFINNFEMYRNFLTDVSKYESNDKTKNVLNDIGKYYVKNEINMACYKYTQLTRYFVFLKK